MKEKDKLILERLSVPDPYCLDLEKSLKSNAPPPLSGKKFSDLKPGDVILVKTENLSKQNDSYEQILNVTSTALTNALSFTDNLFSGTKEDINHTLIYLKEINGKKIFLDNVPGKGPTIISEDEFSFIYGKREANVAEIARPLTKEQGEKLYSAARQLADQQLQKSISVLNMESWVLTLYVLKQAAGLLYRLEHNFYQKQMINGKNSMLKGLRLG
ncbi:MAG: hypothetical protein IPL21_12060 [Saprospirales bacterium]|nr:hypothetical protein [Saprospirales bacterium]